MEDLWLGVGIVYLGRSEEFGDEEPDERGVLDSECCLLMNEWVYELRAYFLGDGLYLITAILSDHFQHLISQRHTSFHINGIIVE